MAERVRRALRERTTLCYAQTWAELQQIVARVSPSAIIADPAADERGDPARNRLPQIAPVIAEGLADAKLVTISGSGAGAPETTAQNIAAVIQTALAAQLVTPGRTARWCANRWPRRGTPRKCGKDLSFARRGGTPRSGDPPRSPTVPSKG